MWDLDVGCMAVSIELAGNSGVDNGFEDGLSYGVPVEMEGERARRGSRWVE